MKASASTRAWLANLLILSAVAIVAVVMIGWYTCFRAFVIASGSMESTLVPGDRILVDRISTFLGAPVHHGDIVAYRWPLDRNMRYVHRVVGLPGDRLNIVNKHLRRNGVEVTEPYAQHCSTLIDSYRDNFPNVPNFPLREPAMDMLENHVVNGEVVVPADHYFVMGDNRDDAADSRYFGFIQHSDLVGRPIVIYGSSDPKRVWKAPR
jgi:signal peptidase I